MNKIVVVEYSERWSNGGIESYILNLIERLNPDMFELRIVVAQKETELYDEELAKCGVKVESILPQICNNPIQRVLYSQKIFENYFKENSCDVLHLHICQGVALRYAKLAKRAGVKKVISHCHNTEIGTGHRVIKLAGHWLGKLIYRNYVDQMVACSDLAAKWLYTTLDLKKGKVIIFKSIVDIDRFAFSFTDRTEMRKKYSVSNDAMVYLSIGRLHYQKNQKFLIDVFKEIQSIDNNSILILIGTGEMKEEIYEYAKQTCIFDKAIFIDKTREISKFMSMSDVFLLTSLFEGNPVVGTEAQASGLPCYFSSTITSQAKILDTTYFLDLKSGARYWAQRIVEKQKDIIEKECREYCADLVKKSGYNVAEQMKMIEQIYKI